MITQHSRTAASRARGLILLLLVVAASCSSDATMLAGYTRDPEPVVSDITLPAVNGDNDRFALRADDGDLLLVYFGFANCPDICPTTLADARQAVRDLGARASDVKLALITIDPDRDNAIDLANYVEFFDPSWVALRSEDAFELQTAADAFGVSWSITTDDNGEIEVGHTPNLFVVDDNGTLKLTWPFGVPAADISSDLTVLFDQTTSDS